MRVHSASGEPFCVEKTKSKICLIQNRVKEISFATNSMQQNSKIQPPAKDKAKVFHLLSVEANKFNRKDSKQKWVLKVSAANITADAPKVPIEDRGSEGKQDAVVQVVTADQMTDFASDQQALSLDLHVGILPEEQRSEGIQGDEARVVVADQMMAAAFGSVSRNVGQRAEPNFAEFGCGIFSVSFSIKDTSRWWRQGGIGLEH